MPFIVRYGTGCIGRPCFMRRPKPPEARFRFPNNCLTHFELPSYETRTVEQMPVNLAAVFLDRDGVLNTHLPGAYVREPEGLEIIPGAACAVRRLNDSKISVVIISNQQGVGKKLMTTDDLGQVDQALRDALFSQCGATIDRS